MKITAKEVKALKKPGRYYTGSPTLYLVVGFTGSKSWVQRLTLPSGQRTDLGLGSASIVTLAEAREKAHENRRLVHAGVDPLALKRRPSIPTFTEAIEEVVKIHEPTWRGKKTAKLWRATLRDYAEPRLGSKRVDQITTQDVMSILLPIWNEKRETASKVRQRIGAVMRWAVAQGYRSDNPAGDAIGAALPKSSGLKRHHRSVPHGQVGDTIAVIRASNAHVSTRLAFEYLVLTASRSQEVRLAEWDEVDLEVELWEIPASRMKAGRPHKVPLSERAVEIMHEAKEIFGGEGLIFPSVRGLVMSDSTISKLTRENGIAASPHGFRASFKTFCSERGVSREVSEMALAHRLGSATEQAYTHQVDLIERRREVMESWSRYLASKPSSKVVSIQRRNA